MGTRFVALLTVAAAATLKPHLPVCQMGYPAINVIGRAECGTSQLYRMLASHAQARPLDAEKDFCASNWKYNRTHQEWIELTAERCDNETQGRGRAIVNGCLNLPETISHLASDTASPRRRAKFLYVLRDPADLLWSSWHYWKDANDHPNTASKVGGRANGGEHWYRSATYFDELIRSRHLLRNSILPRNFTKYLLVQYLLEISRLVGPENLLILKTEDLSNRKQLDRIANFTGLGVDGFAPDVVAGQINKQAHRDEMFNETRGMIYWMARDACKTLKDLFAFELTSCLTSQSFHRKEERDAYFLQGR
jgi:hypothetical protein